MPHKKESEIIKKEDATFNKKGFSPTKLTYDDLYPESYEYTPPQSYTNLKKFFDHTRKNMTNKMNDNEECVCLKGKNCCKCGKILEKEELKPRTDPFAEDLHNDHSEHLICYKCVCISVNEV